MTRSRIVISAITSLYFLNVVQSIAEWARTNKILASAGSSNHANYLSGEAGPHWIVLMSVLNASQLSAIVDLLLVRSLFRSVYFSDHVGRYGGAITYGIAHSA